MDKDHQDKFRRQSEELIRRNLELTLLHEVSAVTSTEMDLNRMLRLVLEKIVDLPIFDIGVRGGIFTVEKERLRLVSQIGLSKYFAKDHSGKKTGRCLCAAAMKSGSIIIPGEGEQQTKHRLDSGADALESQMAVPFKSANRVVGVLFLLSPGGMKMDSRRMGLFELIGSLVGTAIDNARLFGEARELALHDPLTGLANRNLMREVLDNNLARALRTGKPFSVAMLDLDSFKQFNDSYGHIAGDKILKKVGAIVRNEIRAMDLAVRFGGEEFLVILAETGLLGGLQMGERIRRKIRTMNFNHVAGHPAGIITISVGIASYESGVGDVNELISRADDALYQAKRKGGNRVEAWRGGRSVLAV